MPESSRLPQLGDWDSLDEIVRLQEKQLPQLLRAALRSPFYARILDPTALPQAVNDLADLPLTEKDDLRDAYPFGMLAVDKRELATYHESSGTAGRPTPSYYTAEDWIDLAERYARKWVGITSKDVFLVRTPYALMITGHLAHAAARSRGAMVVPGDNRSLAMPYSRVVRVLRDLGVTLTWSMPTETLMWAAAASVAGLDPGRDFPALRALFVGGEPLSDARRRRISEIWQVPVVEEYGSTETGSLAGECPAGRLHLWADRAVFEVYDPATQQVTREGSGQLVVTPLYRAAMPLLRYNLGDDVEISYADCGCGWNLPTVRVLGRSAFAYRAGSARVTQHQLEEIIFALPAQYQVVFWRARAERDGLRVELEVQAEHADAARDDLTAAVARALGVRPMVSTVPPGTLVPTKILTSLQDVMKPRSLFGADEPWDKGLLYY